MSTWDAGFISNSSVNRWRVATVFPLTATDPPATAQKRQGPSSYIQVPQEAFAPGQCKVFMDPGTKIPLLRVAVRENDGSLVWKHVILGKHTFLGGAAWDPQRNLQQDPRRRRIR